MVESIGRALCEERERRGDTIVDVERAIKIRAKYIEALEADDFDSIPGDAYVLGFIKTYCEFLQMDPASLIEAYRSEHETPKLTMPKPVMSATREHPRIPRLAWLIVALVAVGGFGAWFGAGLFSALKPTTPVPEPTATTVVAEPTTTPPAQSKPKPKSKAKVRTPRPFRLKVVAIDGENWLSANVDGRLVYDDGLDPGRSLGWRVRKRAVLSSDTSEMFKVYRDGKYVGPLGAGFGLKRRAFKARWK